MRAHVDGGDDGAVVTADRHRDRAKPRLGLAIDQRIALLAVGDDGRAQAFRIDHGDAASAARASSASSAARGQSSSNWPTHDAADRRAKSRQAIADIEARRKHPRRTAARDEHDLVAVKHRERTDLLCRTGDPVEHRLQHRHHLARTQIGCGQRQHVRRQREQFSVGRNEAAALERKENAARGGARQIRRRGPDRSASSVRWWCRTFAAGAGRGRGSRQNPSRAPRCRCVSAWASCRSTGARRAKDLCLPSRQGMS